MSDNLPVAFDMYGQPIYPLGETGFGVSIDFSSRGPDHQVRFPSFNIFHESDDYRQSLFSASLDLDRPRICNVFQDRIAGCFANEALLTGAPRWGKDATATAFPIYPLGETGFGISLSWFSGGPDYQTFYPLFTVFHESDDFQQRLFSMALGTTRPYMHQIAERRIAEHFANEMHPLGAPSLREDRS